LNIKERGIVAIANNARAVSNFHFQCGAISSKLGAPKGR
jgi:hypothetical protein